METFVRTVWLRIPNITEEVCLFNYFNSQLESHFCANLHKVDKPAETLIPSTFTKLSIIEIVTAAETCNADFSARNTEVSV